MSASQIVPLTVTFTASGAASTATVLGQVLDNGQTNWIPATSGGAIYLATSSAQGDSNTVLAGTSYYVSTGAAVPQQVTISVTGSVANVTSSTSSTSSASSSARMTSSASGSKAASTTSAAATSASATTTASTSTSSSSSSAATRRPVPSATLFAAGVVLCFYALSSL
ncbi:hypothetical protein LTR62_004700 [Meristemomyces frigidus]|uniref:Uncharacterized protein n=1 Tax=Meristemomyces frigidus TaxID=1508187 RepID=A0AAN7TLP4_9PEZI|nr:hypothetical protein LTR62_004700 [Meristemomyces frigidus]